MAKINKIVLTGGPCAGKTTAKVAIQEFFTNKGYSVLFVSETATELITGGISPTTCKNPLEFQKILFHLQCEKEKSYLAGAEALCADKILIVCDRGLLDNKAYMSADEFEEVLQISGLNEVEVRDAYDAVFHLVTTAKGAVDVYLEQMKNNPARTEPPEKAAELDDKLIAAWTGHPHLRVIDNSTDGKEKVARLIKEIALVLGEPEPCEIERKFLIRYPDIQWLESQPNCQKIDIIQTYLNSGKDEEIRVRQRGLNGNYLYFRTTKKKISDTRRIESERRLTKEEYLKALMDADTSKHQIRKTRYCLMYENQYFEIDIYPFWQNQAILEIELNDENAPILFPEEISLIKEVTADNTYKNASLAKEIPTET